MGGRENEPRVSVHGDQSRVSDKGISPGWVGVGMSPGWVAWGHENQPRVSGMGAWESAQGEWHGNQPRMSGMGISPG